MALARLRSLPGQLTLFPQKGKRGRSAPEFAKHCVIVDIIRLWIAPGWKWTHLPFGEYRTPRTAAKLKRMGVMPGWPDFVFVNRRGLHHYVELKRDREVGNPAQEELRDFLTAGGVPYIISSSVDTVLGRLRQWGVLRPEARW